MSYYRPYKKYQRYRRNNEDPVEGILRFLAVVLMFGFISLYFSDPKKFWEIIFGFIAIGIFIGIVILFYKKRNKIFKRNESITHSIQINESESQILEENSTNFNKDIETHHSSNEKQEFPYEKNEHLLSIAENNFYQILNKIAENSNTIIETKVRLEDLIKVPFYTPNYWGLRNRIKSKHIDFVLCDKGRISPLIAIELDDSSHNKPDRIERDNFVDEALHGAGLPILHIRVQQFYNQYEIEKQILDKMTE